MQKLVRDVSVALRKQSRNNAMLAGSVLIETET